MLWFEELMGFKEENPDQVRSNIQLIGNKIQSKVNQKTYQVGTFSIPTLKELRAATDTVKTDQSGLKVSEIVSDVQLLHVLKDNEGALFQAASQFNLLEMTSPKVTPEEGVGIYHYDKTQGPACAIACGAGTIYRNYFVNVEGTIGQSSTKQIDCLSELSDYFDNDNLQLWKMENGYAFAREEGLRVISDKLKSMDLETYEMVKGMLKVGIQWDTEVTLNERQQIVSQVYCSALPIGYSLVEENNWEEFARLILAGTYEATIRAGLINSTRTNNNRIFLTLVGGGVFGNKKEWIIESLLENLQLFKKESLDLRIVSYGTSNPVVQEIIQRFKTLD